MKAIPGKLPDLWLIKTDVFADPRGFLMETWSQKKFLELGLDISFVQENFSRSVKNTLRGLHYQLINPQGKLLRVAAGVIFDVAVDLRRTSPSFGQWAGETLSADDQQLYWVPQGFAHGFLVLSEYADVQYKCTSSYTPEAERCILWSDGHLNITWPLIEGKQPLLSDKDQHGCPFLSAEMFS